MLKLFEQFADFLSKYLKGTNFDYLINYNEYRQWLNSKTPEKLQQMYTEATYTPKSLFDFYREETNKHLKK